MPSFKLCPACKKKMIDARCLHCYACYKASDRPRTIQQELLHTGKKAKINAGTFKKGNTPWNKGLFGPLNPQFKNGMSVSNKGYILIIDRKKNNWKALHRIIAEKAIGCQLKSNEVVHHINGDKSDNRNSNLLICSIGYHTELHRKVARYEKN